MARYDQLDEYIDRRVRALTLDGGRIEGVLESVSHQDYDDVLVINRRGYRLGKFRELYLLGDAGSYRVWPPLAPGEVPEEPKPETQLGYDPALYDRARGLIGRLVSVRAGGRVLLGVLEAIGPRDDARDTEMHLSTGDNVPVTVVQMSSIEKLEPAEEAGLPPLTVSELERDILPTALMGYPFEGRATTSRPLAEIAAQVLSVSYEFTEPVLVTFDRASAYYGLDPVARQGLQALLARLTDNEQGTQDVAETGDQQLPVSGSHGGPPEEAGEVEVAKSPKRGRTKRG